MPPPGTPDAFTALYERHWQDLVAYCRPRLDRADDAEDAAHEALLRAFRALPEVRDDGPLWPWLATIAANVCADMRRRDRRVSAADARSGDVTSLMAPDVHELAGRRLRADLVVRALRRLPPSTRRLLFLRHYEGRTYEEIARTEGTSVASVRSRLMRNRRRLGHRVEEVARAERQWPLPVGWLRRRVDGVRAWGERLVAGLDCGVLLTGLGAGAQVVAAALIVVLGAGPSGTAAHARVVPAGAVVVPGPGPAGPGGGRAVGTGATSWPGAGSAGAGLRHVPARTLRLDPPRPTVGGHAAPTEESTVTVEDHEDWFYVEVNPPLTERPHRIWVPCAGGEVSRLACVVGRQVLEAAD